ncbi:zinc knuckle CX2CX4HX4C containing protein [Tanacetum coccineum]
MVDSSKASGADFIGINNVDSDNINFHDHGNYGMAIPLVAIEEEGMEHVLENSPWLIHLVLIILNIWTPNTRLKKDVITTSPVLVKLHNVPIVAYSEIVLSLITTKLGRPIILDAYTSDMCLKSWGCNNYSQALIEMSLKSVLVDSLVVAISFPNASGHTMETIDIEYEYQMMGLWRLLVSIGMGNKVLGLDKLMFKEKKEPSAPQPNNKCKDVNNETWKASNNVESRMDDSDSEEVKNVFVENNGKPMDGGKADTPKRNLAFSLKMKLHYFDRDDMIFNDMSTIFIGQFLKLASSILHRENFRISSGKGVFDLVGKVGPVPPSNESITFYASTGPSNVPPNLDPFENVSELTNGGIIGGNYVAEQGVEVMTGIEPSYVPESSGQHYPLAGVAPR